MSFKLILIVCKDWNYFCSCPGVFMLFVGIFQLITFFMIVLMVYYTLTISSMFIMSISAILLIKLKQLSILLYFPYRKGCKKRYSPSLCLRYFFKHYTITIRHVFAANNFYGKAILLFIIASWPCNIIDVVYVTVGGIPLQSSSFLCVILFQQTLCLFGNHYLATMFCRTIHQPSKRLLRLDVLVKSLNTRDHLKLCHYTQMLHTDNQYGITYGNVLGLITVKKFFQVSQF